ncbi:lipoprotein N-acyltransferase Lnb domain-containing protein [Luteimonas sp. A649]
MTLAKSRPGKSLAPWLSRLLTWLVTGISFIARVGVLAWGSMAIYWSNLPWDWLRLVSALAFAAFGIWALWLARKPRARLAFVGLFAVVLVWWLLIPPSNDRPWLTEVAVVPRAVVDGDRVRISGVRNFDFRSRDDFTVRYEEREVSLSHLTGVDLFISYWAKGPVGHTFVSFIFDNAPPVTISIETRPEQGESFAPIASMFKQFELIYLVGDEHDLVGVRTTHRDEDVFLYRLQTSPERARQLFLVYIDRINALADKPEWYHLLSNSCTINIVRYANKVGREGGFDIRHLLNGLIDGYLYEAGFLDTSLPFEELRRRSHINAASQAADGAEDFSQRIRESLPGFEAQAITSQNPVHPARQGTR